MEQYIPKAAIVAEILKRIKKLSKEFQESETIQFSKIGQIYALENLNYFIDTLEVKEVDLEKEIDNIWNSRFNLGWDEKSLLSMNHEGFTTITKHFFELGLKAQKGE